MNALSMRKEKHQTRAITINKGQILRREKHVERTLIIKCQASRINRGHILKRMTPLSTNRLAYEESILL